MGLERGWAYIGGQLKYSNQYIRPARWDKVGLSGVGWGPYSNPYSTVALKRNPSLIIKAPI